MLLAVEDASTGAWALMGTAALSAIRAFGILEYFETVRAPLSLKAIASGLNIPTSSTAALLKSLSERGFLSYDIEERTYLPTLRLATLGDWVPNRIMEDGVFELIRKLRLKMPDTIVVATLNDLHVDSIDFKLSKRDAGQYFLDESYAPPVGAVAVTCPLAWFMMKDFSMQRLERIYYRSKSKHLFDSAALTWELFVERIETARSSRYILARHWPVPMGSVLAAAIPVFPFGRHIALGVGASNDHMNDDIEPMLDTIDSELGRLHGRSTAGGFRGKPPSERMVEVDAQVGYLSMPAL